MTIRGWWTVTATTVAVAIAGHAAGAQAPAPPPAEPQQGFTYSAEGRRDPFVSLLRRGTGVDTAAASRPAGLAGLGTADISLRGVLSSRDGYVAIVRGADSRTYIVRQGQKLADGTVRIIDAISMVIMQEVDDPLSKNRERAVVKPLRQEEAK